MAHSPPVQPKRMQITAARSGTTAQPIQGRSTTPTASWSVTLIARGRGSNMTTPAGKHLAGVAVSVPILPRGCALLGVIDVLTTGGAADGCPSALASRNVGPGGRARRESGGK